MPPYQKHEIEPGTKIGYWTVIKQVPRPNPKNKGRYYLCKCKCGKEKIIDGKYLRDGRSRSCGCRSAEALRRKRKQRRVLVKCPGCDKERYIKMKWIGNGQPRIWCDSCKGYLERGTDPDLNELFESGGKLKYTPLESIPPEEFVISYG